MRLSWRDELPFQELRLAILSFIFLYYELACIRWASAFVLYLSYYANIVLLACFLGMGLGMLAARRRRTWIEYASMLFGYRVLLVPVAILYAAVAAWPRRSAGTDS